MARPFAKLRGLLMQNDIDQRYLCELMKKSQTYITNRFTARQDWTQKDQYFFMDLLNYPYDQMHELFPKEGKKIS